MSQQQYQNYNNGNYKLINFNVPHYLINNFDEIVKFKRISRTSVFDRTYRACLHDEWKMTWHSTGKVTNKTSMSAEQMKAIMENADIKDRRCIYENDEILVQHMRADYPNGTKDATMHVSLKKDGLLWRSETGVTSVKT